MEIDAAWHKAYLKKNTSIPWLEKPSFAYHLKHTDPVYSRATISFSYVSVKITLSAQSQIIRSKQSSQTVARHVPVKML
jgi:hypothetical protein